MGDVDSASHNFSQTKETFIQWGQYLSTDGADESGVEDWGQGWKGPAMTGGSGALFLQPDQELEHAVNIRS